jgi:hypothetical protein
MTSSLRPTDVAPVDASVDELALDRSDAQTRPSDALMTFAVTTGSLAAGFLSFVLWLLLAR